MVRHSLSSFGVSTVTGLGEGGREGGRERRGEERRGRGGEVERMRERGKEERSTI